MARFSRLDERVSRSSMVVRLLLWGFMLGSFAWSGIATTSAETRGIDVVLRSHEAADAPKAETVRLYGKSHALVIGIDYRTHGDGWPPLNNAVKDAERVTEALEGRGFEVTLLKNLDAETLEGALEDFFIDKGDDPEARLFVWFAGHGHSERGQGYLVPADAPLPQKDARGFKRKALSMRRFGEYVREARSKHVFTVFDSCFSGTIFEGARATPPVAITKATTLPVRQFLSSGDADQQVSDDGTFRELFIDALAGRRGADANRDGYLTASELGLFLTDSMINYTNDAQTPKYGKLRDKDWDQGDFVFKLAALTPAEKTPVLDDGCAAARTAWTYVEKSARGADFEAFINRFGDCFLADLARTRSAELKQSAQVASVAPSAPVSTVSAPRPSFDVTSLDQTMLVSGASLLNVREYPGGEKIGGLKAGERVEVTGRTQHKDARWYRVAMAGGSAGFVFGKYLVEKPASPVQPAVGVFAKPVIPPKPAEPEYPVGKVFSDCPSCPEMVVVPSGSFMMGSPASEPERNDDEGPLHRVTIPAPFAVGKYEVTFAEWDACVFDGGCGGYRPIDRGWGRDRRPVINVSWDDAKKYVSWLSGKTGKAYRMLSESEWEYVARAGTTTAYHTGSVITKSQAKFGGDGEFVPVGRYAPNGFGVHDVHGNVYEWVEDCWIGNYENAPSDGTVNATGDCSRRVLRGGSWNGIPGDLRSANRNGIRTVIRGSSSGFRVARTLPR